MQTDAEGRENGDDGELSPVSNDGHVVIDGTTPYTMLCTIEGVAPILFHRYSVEAVEAKAGAAKGSKAKKEDDLESYVYRDDEGFLAGSGEWMRMGIVKSGSRHRDPSSTGRKSMMDLLKASIVVLEVTPRFSSAKNPEGYKAWDGVDQRRVVVQRNAITRSRPFLDKGWRLTFPILCQSPEYITPTILHDLVTTSGRLLGMGDFRPTYGRFQVIRWEIEQLG